MHRAGFRLLGMAFLPIASEDLAGALSERLTGEVITPEHPSTTRRAASGTG